MLWTSHPYILITTKKQVKTLEDTPNSVTIQLEGVDRSYANAVRRFCIAEVPSMAIDDVVILENSSVLYDEILAHRLGMVPIKTDLEHYVLPEKCDCGSPLGCHKCRVLFVLEQELRLSSIGQLGEDLLEVLVDADKDLVL
jgi:DNA-directed RNA polymerase subunit D